MRELADLRRKLAEGASRLGEFTEEDLAIATTPADEVYREDMMRMYRCRPTAAKRKGVAVLIVYALVGRYQMIDLESDRSFVRKLLAEGIDVYYIDWGNPTRAQRWLTIDDYVSGYLDNCVDVVRAREGVDKINLMGICQGGVFSTCYAALFPHKVARLMLTVTPLDFHGDVDAPARGSGYMNLWARSLTPKTSIGWSTRWATRPARWSGFSFLMMNPIGNLTKYSIDLLDILDDDKKLLGFLRMERWISDRPNNPGEVVRQWFKDLYQGNKLIRNELVLGGKKVDLKRITMPVLNIYAEGDVVVPNSCSQGMQGSLRNQGLHRARRARRPHWHVRRRQGAEDPGTQHRQVADGRRQREFDSTACEPDRLGQFDGRGALLGDVNSSRANARVNRIRRQEWQLPRNTSPGPAPDQEGHCQRLDRLGAGVLRLLHLRHRGVADLPADLLPARPTPRSRSSPRSPPTAWATSPGRSAPSSSATGATPTAARWC